MIIQIDTLPTFKKFLKDNSSRLVILKFSADWCRPCAKIEPFIEELAKKFKDVCIIAKIDVDINTSVSDMYSVKSMPTFVFIINSEEVERTAGANENKIITALNKCVDDYPHIFAGQSSALMELI